MKDAILAVALGAVVVALWLASEASGPVAPVPGGSNTVSLEAWDNVKAALRRRGYRCADVKVANMAVPSGEVVRVHCETAGLASLHPDAVLRVVLGPDGVVAVHRW